MDPHLTKIVKEIKGFILTKDAFRNAKIVCVWWKNQGDPAYINSTLECLHSGSLCC